MNAEVKAACEELFAAQVATFEEIRMAAEQVGQIINRPDWYAAIVQMNAEIIFSITNYATPEALETLVEKFRAVVKDACTAAVRLDLYDKIVQANSNLAVVSVRLNELRRNSPAVDEWFQAQAERAAGFHQSSDTMH